MLQGIPSRHPSQIKTVAINSIAENDVLRTMGTKVLLDLHEKENIPGILTNAESWTLNCGEKTKLERIEIQAIKYLFDLPAHTPTPAILFTFGLPYTNVRVDKKRFIYLHRVLNRDDDNWPEKNSVHFTRNEHRMGQKYQ